MTEAVQQPTTPEHSLGSYVPILEHINSKRGLPCPGLWGIIVSLKIKPPSQARCERCQNTVIIDRKTI